MRRHWIIAPVQSEPRSLFDKVWQFDLANSLISIGWAELGDVSKMSRQELAEAVASTYPEKPPGAKGLVTNMIWAFYHEIASEDVVIARRGLKILAAVGKVTQPAVYSPGKNPYIGHPNFLGVSWQESPHDRVFPKIVFPMYTLHEARVDEFDTLVSDVVDRDVANDAIESQTIEDPNAFVLEKYLEDFIVSNFHTIFKDEMTIYDGSEGNGGQQYKTDVGQIDILAVERKSNSFVIIELKKGRPSDQVIGQILRYMGWVKRNLCHDGQAVKGLVICRDPDPKLSYALEMTNDIRVLYYTVSFKLAEAPTGIE
jgi:Endonuclease NucS C-terminal domain